jgi:hypothetical protein
MGESLAHDSAEGRIVTRAAAHNEGDGALGRAGAAHHSAGDAADLARIRGHESLDHLVGELGRIIEEACHVLLLVVGMSSEWTVSGRSPALSRRG